MRRSHSNKTTPVGKRITFTRDSFRRASFSKKKETPLIAPTSESEFLGNDHSTFEMHTITDKSGQ